MSRKRLWRKWVGMRIRKKNREELRNGEKNEKILKWVKN